MLKYWYFQLLETVYQYLKFWDVEKHFKEVLNCRCKNIVVLKHTFNYEARKKVKSKWLIQIHEQNKIVKT